MSTVRETPEDMGYGLVWQDEKKPGARVEVAK